MLATYIDQLVAEDRMAEIAREATKVRLGRREPARRQTIVEIRGEAPVIELNLMTEVAKLAA